MKGNFELIYCTECKGDRLHYYMGNNYTCLGCSRKMVVKDSKLIEKIELS